MKSRFLGCIAEISNAVTIGVRKMNLTVIPRYYELVIKETRPDLRQQKIVQNHTFSGLKYDLNEDKVDKWTLSRICITYQRPLRKLG